MYYQDLDLQVKKMDDFVLRLVLILAWLVGLDPDAHAVGRYSEVWGFMEAGALGVSSCLWP